MTCVDPNPNFEKFLIKCIAQADTCSLSPSDGCRGEHAPGGHRLLGCGGLHPGALLREEPGADPPGSVPSAEAGECGHEEGCLVATTSPRAVLPISVDQTP